MTALPLHRLLLAAIVLLPITLLPSLAAAQNWTTLPGSTLGFAGAVEGEPFDGRFQRFDARIRFDPTALTGRFEVDIALDSVDSQNSERDDMLAEPEFFDSRRLPQARYLAERFERQADGRIRADGVLSLRGVEQPVPLLFDWQPSTDGAVLDGQAVVDRLAFEVGSGDWADPALIAREVQVRPRLLLRRAD
jgi:polyisoprenoid-binding protein YceI